jgi:hypothetical protein
MIHDNEFKVDLGLLLVDATAELLESIEGDSVQRSTCTFSSLMPYIRPRNNGD